MFKCVIIPHDSTDNLTELELPVAGGLNNDALKLSAESYFTNYHNGETKLNLEQQMIQMNSEWAKYGMDPKQLDEKLKYHVLEGKESVEIVTLALPNIKNGFQGVSLYCDSKGKIKKLPTNIRATSLANTCGCNIVVYGTAFIGRCHDDESKEWIRLDFSLDDMNSDAVWIQEAKVLNSGKNMNAYTTSGTLQNMLNTKALTSSSQNGENQSLTNTQSSTTVNDSKDLQWSQTEEEIEIRLKINKLATSKSVKLSIKKQSLQLNDISNFEEEMKGTSELARKIRSANGIRLFAPIDTDGSTWSIESNEDSTSTHKNLIVTLCKYSEGEWPRLTE